MAKFETLKNKVVVVAGGGKNLGALVSQNYADVGAKVVVHYHSASSKAEAEQTIAAIKNKGGEAVLFNGDLTSAVKMKELFDFAVSQYGNVDIAVNTIGKVLRKPIVETTEEEYNTMHEINGKAAYFFIKEAANHMNDNGKIITIVTALLAAYTDGYSTYAGEKAPVEHYTRAASAELMNRGISVNNIAPGPMDTPFFYPEETEERVAFHKSQALHNQLTQIEDIAPLIKFLTTDGWWINGQTIFANGGYTTR